MFARKNIIRFQTGMTLIELLISLAISLLLLALLIEIYLSTHRSLQIQHALYAIQENGRTASVILTSAINQSGHIGCARLTTDFPIISHTSHKLNAKNKIRGTSHEITVRYREYPNVVLNKNTNADQPLYASDEIKFKPNDVIMISNCKNAEIFSIKSIHFKNGNQEIVPSRPLHYSYDKFSELGLLAVDRYYISKTKRRNQNGQPVYALFLQNIRGQKTELIENITNMKITYTVNKSGNLKDISANQVINWSEVAGAAIDIDLYAGPLEKTWHVYAALNE